MFAHQICTWPMYWTKAEINYKTVVTPKIKHMQGCCKMFYFTCNHRLSSTCV